MKSKNCGKHVFEVPMAFCLSQERNRVGSANACPVSCDKEKDRMTCGSDGNVYRSECEMKMLNCGWERKLKRIKMNPFSYAFVALRIIYYWPCTCAEFGRVRISRVFFPCTRVYSKRPVIPICIRLTDNRPRRRWPRWIWKNAGPGSTSATRASVRKKRTRFVETTPRTTKTNANWTRPLVCTYIHNIKYTVYTILL